MDYSNKYGFGCMLSDGTVSVKFNDGEILSLDRSNRGVFLSSPNAKPQCISRMREEEVSKYVKVAKSYRAYMDTHLTDAVKGATDEVRYLFWRETMMT